MDASISVIVPFHNSARHIRQLFESLAQQDCTEPWEVIAVDNGSTDESRTIVEEFAGRIQLRVIEANERANGSYARNVGVRAASGEYLLFIDADDEVDGGYVSAMARALESHDFVTSRVDSTSLNAEWLHDAHGPPWQADGVIVFFDFMPATGVNVGLRRELFDRVGGFPEDFSGSQDIVFSWNVQLAGSSIYFERDAEYRYRYRESLVGLFKQTVNWGFSNTLLYSRFRERGMPRRPLSAAWKEWKDVLGELLRSRNKQAAAPLVVRLGYCVGRARGSVRNRVMYF